ncbi:ATPase regulatory subunit 13 [Seminavis robusta]|uniref:ATPase regulatory subunit 13 n=1 Tax=Seminavis robusta TaxID=568900 RepID=A0A9N8HJV3_9STRA|nr:ATPase regulatory subunit 13 [Seminavis robusta]|eukprot:Sro792_g203100.1 ATPase regulatory subunit 13 (415) ;mRNA; f:21945-23189
MSSYVDATSGAVDHCQLMAQQQPDLAADYYKIASSCKEKLWHQLTLTILDLVSKPTTTLRSTPEGTNSYLALYDKVVLSIDTKLNPLSLARIASYVAASLTAKTSDEKDTTAAKAVLENLLANKKDTLGTPATIFVQSKLSLLSLNADDKTKLDQIKTIVKSNGELLKEMIDARDTSESAIVHSAHYEMAMTYYKVVGPPESFYDQAMSFLNYAPLLETTDDAKTAYYHQLAVDLCLAALTGEGVYNLGQVVSTPVLAMLANTPESWLVDMLKACAKGQVVEFNTLTTQYADAIAKQPALVHRATAVKEKLTLLALVNLVFEKHSSERTLGFQEVADRLHIDILQVEWVIMRALSLQLIEGSMDQVDQTVSVTWVLPRVLDTTELQALAGRFGEWAVKVSKTKDYMQEQTPTFA